MEKKYTDMSPKEKIIFHAFLAGRYLAASIPKIDYIYSNNSTKDSPFYYDIVKIYGEPFPVYMPVPVLIHAFALTLPVDEEYRNDPELRALEFAYDLRICEFMFNIQRIISKKNFLHSLKK